MRARTVALILILASFSTPTTSRGQQTRTSFRGVVYDFDFGLGRNRVVVQLRSGTENLIAETASSDLMRILETALIRDTEVLLEFEPGEKNRIVSARLQRNDRRGIGQVLELRFDEATAAMEAKVRQDEGEIVVTTKDPRAQAILQCAIQEGRPVDELEYSQDSNSLERIKLTVLR
jgi:hypothetical protein